MSLEGADRAYIYTAGLGWDAPAVFASMGAKSFCADDLDELIRTIAKEAKPGDQVLVMSNGGFGGIHGKLLSALGKG
jgi:UDP-N-acetylmuramate: L-alanyl-gamma-D-glutamyl-meso-diaminopimelate ligase